MTLNGVSAHRGGMVTNGNIFHTERSLPGVKLTSKPVSRSTLHAWYYSTPHTLPFRDSSNSRDTNIVIIIADTYSSWDASTSPLSSFHVPTNLFLISTLWVETIVFPILLVIYWILQQYWKSHWQEKRISVPKENFLLPNPSGATVLRVSKWKQERGYNSALRLWGQGILESMPWLKQWQVCSL